LGAKENIPYTLIDERMNDLTQRHIGSIYTASGAPTQHAIVNSNARKVYRSNIWFFQPGGGGAGFAPDASISSTQCTFSNPCSGLSQSTINTINVLAPNANFYLSPGNYNVTGLNANNTVILNNGQSVYGRAAGYILAASGSNRANIQEGMVLNGNNALDSLQITSTNSKITSGVFGVNVIGVATDIAATGNITLNNLNLNVTDNSSGAIAVALIGNNTVNISNTTAVVNENNLTSTDGANGLAIENGGVVTLNHTNWSVIDNSNSGGTGIVGFNVNALTINNSIVNATSNVFTAAAIAAFNNSQINVNNSSLSSLTTNVAGTGNGTIDVFQAASVTVNNSSLYAEDTSSANGATNIFVSASGGALLSITRN
jgi:hypothetical protein